MESRQVDRPQESLDDLRREVEELRASRMRLVLAEDAWSRELERQLHDSLQQRLVVLSVDLQHASALAESDPAEAKSALDRLALDVQTLVDEAGRLAERLHAPLLEVRGRLAAALRAAAVTAGVQAEVDVEAGSDLAPEIAHTVFLCWLEALAHAKTDGSAKITVRADEAALSFAIASSAELGRWRDRVEALSGRLHVDAAAGASRISGSLPFSRRP